MDKELGIIALFFIGTAVLLLIVGVYGLFKNDSGMDKAESDGNCDSCICDDSSGRKHCGMDRHTTEEMIQVLQVLRMGACRYEREILNEVIEILKKGEDDGR